MVRVHLMKTFSYFCFVNMELFSENNYRGICMNFEKTTLLFCVSNLYNTCVLFVCE